VSLNCHASSNAVDQPRRKQIVSILVLLDLMLLPAPLGVNVQRIVGRSRYAAEKKQ
jgi:hypothetical protein